MWQYNQTVLQHHGVKGMRWGRRKGGLASAPKPTTNYSKVSAKKSDVVGKQSDLKKAKKEYKQSKKEYKTELKKRNENYELKKVDRLLGKKGQKTVNTLLNTNGDMPVSQARKNAAIQVGRGIALTVAYQ